MNINKNLSQLKISKKLFLYITVFLFFIIIIFLILKLISPQKNNDSEHLDTNSNISNSHVLGLGTVSLSNVSAPTTQMLQTSTIPTISTNLSSPSMSSIVSLDKWIFYPVDKSKPLPSDFVPTGLVPVVNNGIPATASDRLIKNIVLPDLKDLFAASKNAGLNMEIVSAYRSYSYQQNLFQSYVNSEIAKGLPKADAEAKANTYSAHAGNSEHQLGTTMDIDHDGTLNTTNSNTKVWDWLDKNIEKYGFVLSYSKNKDQTTGYINEPWHIRWVGKDIASKILATDYKNSNNVNTSTSYLREIWQSLNK